MELEKGLCNRKEKKGGYYLRGRRGVERRDQTDDAKKKEIGWPPAT